MADTITHPESLPMESLKGLCIPGALDTRDLSILLDRIKARMETSRPLQGDFVQSRDRSLRWLKPWRIAYIWEDDPAAFAFQPVEGGDGSLHLNRNGSGTMSGGCGDLIRGRLSPTGGWCMAPVWFFHHAHSGAGRGVYTQAPARIWHLDPI